MGQDGFSNLRNCLLSDRSMLSLQAGIGFLSHFSFPNNYLHPFVNGSVVGRLSLVRSRLIFPLARLVIRSGTSLSLSLQLETSPDLVSDVCASDLWRRRRTTKIMRLSSLPICFKLPSSPSTSIIPLLPTVFPLAPIPRNMGIALLRYLNPRSLSEVNRVHFNWYDYVLFLELHLLNLSRRR